MRSSKPLNLVIIDAIAVRPRTSMKRVLSFFLAFFFYPLLLFAASPSVAATNTSASSSEGTSQVVSLPASIQAGETLLIGLGCDGNIGTDATATGWTQLKRLPETVSNVNTNHVLYKKATGSEGASVTVTIGQSEHCGHWSARISGAADPTVTAPEVSAGAVAETGNADPDAITPSSSKDYLFIATASLDGAGVLCTAAPTNYSTLLSIISAGAANASAVACAAFRQLTTGSAENPGAFTNSTDGWAAFTVLVHPAAVVSSTSMGLSGVGK